MLAHVGVHLGEGAAQHGVRVSVRDGAEAEGRLQRVGVVELRQSRAGQGDGDPSTCVLLSGTGVRTYYPSGTPRK